MKKRKGLSLAIAIALTASTGTVFAAPDNADTKVKTTEVQVSTVDEETDVYNMDDTIVTATRTTKKDVDVPASTVILTAEKIKESGATNAAEALSKVNGFTYKSMGARGASMGTMNNELGIRGHRNGTLVLLNGNPVSWRGKYNLEMIPAQNIERIEIVKGGGSVLYGSEAVDGVVNIIMKKQATNEVSMGVGNFGQQNYTLSAGDDIFGLHYSFDRWGEQDGVSNSEVKSKAFYGATRTDLHNVEKRNIGFTFNINPRLQLSYDNFQTKADYRRFVSRVDTTSKGVTVGEQFNGREYTTEQHVTQLNYKDKDWKIGGFWNTGIVESQGPTFISSTKKTPDGFYNTRERNNSYGLDVQRNWRIGEKSTAIMGFNMEREQYKKLAAYSTVAKDTQDRSRNIWGVFGQWEQKFDDKNTGILGLRETWTSGAAENYSNCSGSLQWLHKMNENNNLYASINQSFIMPTFAQMFGSSALAIPAPNLKPETGVNYEIGWKQVHNNHSWKVAIFHSDIKDNITANWDKGKQSYTYNNEDFRNTGIELSCDISTNNGWSYQYGITWQNPESRSEVKGDYWDRTQGKLQLTGGISYKKDKWTSALTASYLYNRVQSPSKAHSYECKPYFLTSWRTSYAPDDATELALTINNVLDRDDVAMHTGSDYYVAPINYMLSFNYRF